MNKFLPELSSAEAVLPDDVVEEIHHHVAGQDRQHHVGHRLPGISPSNDKNGKYLSNVY